MVNRFRSYGVLTPRKLPFPTDFLRRPYNSVRTAVRHCDVSAPVVDSQQAATRLAECIELLDRWKGQKSLKLNTEKTQLMWLGSRHQLAKLTVSQLPLATTTSSSTVDIVSTANDLDVILDGQLTMARHTSRLSAVQVFFQLRQLRSVRRSLTTEATRALVQAFCHPTTATLFWPESSAIPVCAERGSPLGFWGSSPRSRWFLLAYTGFQYASELSTRRPCLCGSVYMMQPLAIWLICVCRPIPCMVAINCVLRRLGLRWSRAPGLLPVSAASLSMDHEHGTVCQPDTTLCSFKRHLKGPPVSAVVCAAAGR